MLKLLTAVFIGWMVSRLVVRVKRRQLTVGEFTLWAGFWLLVLAAALWPHATDVVAWWFGIGRGADLLIFLSIVALFTLAWWLLSRMAKIERDITEIVRQEALRRAARNSEFGIQHTEAGRPPRDDLA